MVPGGDDLPGVQRRGVGEAGTVAHHRVGLDQRALPDHGAGTDAHPSGPDRAGPHLVPGERHAVPDDGVRADLEQVGADGHGAREDHRAGADACAEGPQVERVERRGGVGERAGAHQRGDRPEPDVVQAPQLERHGPPPADEHPLGGDRQQARDGGGREQRLEDPHEQLVHRAGGLDPAHVHVGEDHAADAEGGEQEQLEDAARPVHPRADRRHGRVLRERDRGPVPGRVGRSQLRRQPPDRGVGVHEPDRHRREVGLLTQSRRDAGEGERVRPEVVHDMALDRDPVEVQDLGERRRELFLATRRGRDDVPARGSPPGRRCRQRTPVDLAARHHRDVRESLEVGRHHVRGQGTAQAHHQGLLVERDAVLAAVVADQLGHAGLRRVRRDDRLRDPRDGGEDGLDLTELHPVTPDLHLGVRPADVGEPLGVGPDQVATAVRPAPSQCGERTEGRRVLLRVEVARRPDPGDDELPDLAGPHGMSPLGVDDGELPPGQRQPDADRLVRAQAGGARHDRGLRRSVGVPHLVADRGEAVGQLLGTGLAAEDQQADAPALLAGPQPGEGRDRRHDRDAAGREPVADLGPGTDERSRGGHQAAPVAPRQPHLLAGGVERHRERGHHPVPGAERLPGQEQPGLGVDEGGRAAV